MKYCSQCKFSKYVVEGGQRQLHCSKAEKFDLEAFLPTNCISAEMCPLFEPERAKKKVFCAWLQDMKRSHIPLTSYLEEIY